MTPPASGTEGQTPGAVPTEKPKEVSTPTADSTHATVLAIDPGSAKCGLAVVRRDGTILFQGIVTAETVMEETRRLLALYTPVTLLIGTGTGSRPLQRQLNEAGFSTPLLPVEESHTSELARARFVTENPARGWQRLLPRSLRTPWRPYDDYVAIILAERYWAAAPPADSAQPAF